MKVLEINDNYIDLELKYNLLNSHLIGENVVICDSKTSINNFTTQNLLFMDNGIHVYIIEDMT